MIVARLRKEKEGNKKYKVVITDGTKVKTIKFGDKRYEDYTKHKNKIRKTAYDIRHFRRENWFNPYTAGFWSKWLLWNKRTIEGSIKDIESKFDIKIV